MKNLPKNKAYLFLRETIRKNISCLELVQLLDFICLSLA